MSEAVRDQSRVSPDSERRSTAPLRTCVGCRQRDEQGALLRLALVGGCLVADARRRATGRGLYVHRWQSCVDVAALRGGLARALRRPVSPGEARKLREEVLGRAVASGVAAGSEGGAERRSGNLSCSAGPAAIATGATGGRDCSEVSKIRRGGDGEPSRAGVPRSNISRRDMMVRSDTPRTALGAPVSDWAPHPEDGLGLYSRIQGNEKAIRVKGQE
jgi:hypothetical protein